jgi:acyl-CoA oxidase
MPSISAAKFWPGELGLLATWALVYAQTIVKGKNCGVQAFFVQIRD